jgi:Acyl carrier protein
MEEQFMEEKIIAKIVEQLDIDRDTINSDSRFIEDFEMDSLDMVEMLIGIEKELNIMIPNEELKDVKTVGELAAYLEKKANEE